MKHSDLMLWNADMGFGFYPCDPSDAPYDAAYVAKYEAMAQTGMALSLNRHRTSLALYAADQAEQGKNIRYSYIDIGPGDGAFIRALSDEMSPHEDLVYGFDVNPVMVQRLKDEARYALPCGRVEFNNPEDDHDGFDMWSCMTFWDSFEHILRPDRTIRKAKSVAMSIPIFDNREHALASKHFRPDEHIWYFTDAGIKAFMKREGFECLHADDQETRLGREGIKSYVFRRENLRKI